MYFSVKKVHCRSQGIVSFSDGNHGKGGGKGRGR